MSDTNRAACNGVSSSPLFPCIGCTKLHTGLYTDDSLSSVSANILTNLLLCDGLMSLYSAHQPFAYSRNCYNASASNFISRDCYFNTASSDKVSALLKVGRKSRSSWATQSEPYLARSTGRRAALIWIELRWRTSLQSIFLVPSTTAFSFFLYFKTVRCIN
jgi:hypothetical protein